jgi:rhodanese-related sulfurtransferase
VIDVRTGAEFDAEHIPGSRLIPLDQIEKRVDEVRATPAPRLLMCRSGARAGMARSTLAALHVSGLTVVEGGVLAFSGAGGETEKGRAVMSLERQVRILAGALTLVGVALGALVTPWFYALSGFIGAGLVFAGVTDTCGMGLMLGKMPWNRGSSSASAAGTPASCAAAPPSCAAAPPTAACAAPPPKS